MRYKFLFSLALNFLFLKAIGQTNEVSLVVSSKGTTEEEARTNALRSAIEQAFGTFVSSRTEILDDNLVQDQIVSLSNGNIKKFEVLSSLFLTEQNSHLVTLNATVSLDKLTSFVQSKGYNDVSFDGGGFAMNLKIQKLNASSEVMAIRNLLEQGLLLNDGFFDRELKVSDPILEGSNDDTSRYQVSLTVNTILNGNWRIFHDYYIKTLKNIAMPNAELKSYKDLNKPVYEFVLVKKSRKESVVYTSLDTLHFRTNEALSYLTSFCILLNAKYLDGVKIVHSIDTMNLDINYNAEYRIASKRNHSSLRNLWFIGEMPFVHSTDVNTYLEKVYVGGQAELVKRINYFPTTSEYYTMPLFNFTANGYRIDSYQAVDESIQLFTKALNSSDYLNALKSINDQIITRGMPLGFYFYNWSGADFRNRIFDIQNTETTQYQIQINASFTEQEIEQIKGFKLVN